MASRHPSFNRSNCGRRWLSWEAYKDGAGRIPMPVPAPVRHQPHRRRIEGTTRSAWKYDRNSFSRSTRVCVDSGSSLRGEAADSPTVKEAGRVPCQSSAEGARGIVRMPFHVSLMHDRRSTSSHHGHSGDGRRSCDPRSKERVLFSRTIDALIYQYCHRMPAMTSRAVPPGFSRNCHYNCTPFPKPAANVARRGMFE
jgi:hypothetical protein